MITIGEHYGFYENGAIIDLNKYSNILLGKNYSSLFQRSNTNKESCYNLYFNENVQEYQLTSSYIIGVGWIVKNKLPIYIKPKLNTEKSEVNYLLMLFEALKETENLKHLDNLYQIDFKAPLIEIEQHQDLLSPLLVIEYLNTLKQIVKKGLKKSYYKVTDNLNTRVKGKILVNSTVKKNHTKGLLQYNYCTYQEFGHNSLENRILKKALIFSQSLISNHKTLSSSGIRELINYISPAFTNVSTEVSLREVTNLKKNPFFKEYKHAIQIAKTILKRFSYNITLTSETKYKTPPFWIDMPKLFELYTFKKLKEIFPLKGEVTYHKKFNSLEPDLLIRSKDDEFKVIVDAKYKPKYENGNISHDDASQVSGYSRLKKVRAFFNLCNHDEGKTLDTLILYTHNSSQNDLIEKERILTQENEDKRYYKLYKYHIKLPKI